MLKNRFSTEKFVKIFLAATFVFIIFGASLVAKTVLADSANLIANSDFSQLNASGMPTSWIKGRWGDNKAMFTFPASGPNGSAAAQVNLTQRNSGDAKWAFASVPATGGSQYQFGDYYTSSVPTIITVEFAMNDGTFVYKDLATLDPSQTFQPASVKFVAPANVKSLTVFHLINQVGTLTTANHVLKQIDQISPPPTDPTNLVQNQSFENVGANNLPVSWTKGRWGSNAATFTFPVNGHSGQNAARVEITSYTSGDAKWAPADIPVTVGQAYQFSDFYKSNTPSYVTLQFILSDGTVKYLDLGGSLDQAPDWTEFQMPFTVPANAVSVKVFHLIKSVGWIEVDDYRLTKIATDPTKFSTGMVSINFDDGWLSTYQNAIPILNNAGLKSDFFVVTGRMGDGFPAYVKTNQVLTLQQEGHEIGAHTVDHVDLTLTPPDQAQQEITQSRSDLLSIGVTPVNYFAYPFGAYNSDVEQMVKSAGFLAARSSDGGYNDRYQDTFALRRRPMLNSTTLDQIKSYINTATQNKTWVILLFHEVDNSGNLYSTTPQLFGQVVDYLKQTNTPVVTISQGLSALKK